MVLYAFPREDDAPADADGDGPRLGLSVSRKVGGAVERNARQARPARGVLGRGGAAARGADYVVVARPDALELTERDGMPGVQRSLAALVDELEDVRPMTTLGRRGRDRSDPALPPGRSRRPLPARCKYHPSCSAYAVQAVETYGILRGSVLAAWRLLRCNPFSHGGYDPVSAQRLFRSLPVRTSDSSHS